MKITIVISYYQRLDQLINTLDSFRQYKDINVVIVDDNSPDDIQIQPYQFPIDILKLKEKHWIAPCPVFNFGFVYALKSSPDAIIIQNAECYHRGDIIGYVRANLTQLNYLSFACYSLGQGEGVDFTAFNNKTAASTGDSAWYNHSVWRPEALNFCCAITTENLRKINGFDERFSDGLGYEDNYFIHQVRTLGLRVKIVDDPFVLHQYHYDSKAFTFNQYQYALNGTLCRELMREKNYKAVHKFTPDL